MLLGMRSGGWYQRGDEETQAGNRPSGVLIPYYATPLPNHRFNDASEFEQIFSNTLPARKVIRGEGVWLHPLVGSRRHWRKRRVLTP